MTTALKQLALLLVLALFLPACGGEAEQQADDDGEDEQASQDDADDDDKADEEFERKLAQDRANLQQLMEAVLIGYAGGKGMPGSTGKQFWLALFVGDGPGGTLEFRNPDDAFLSLEHAHVLRSPFDEDVPSVEAIQAAIRNAFEEGLGADALGPEYVSYAGPKGEGSAHSPRVALLTERNRSGFVGATGTRDGVGLIPGGFHAVNQSAEVTFFSYEDLAEDFPNYAEAEAPLFEEGVLEYVEE